MEFNDLRFFESLHTLRNEIPLVSDNDDGYFTRKLFGGKWSNFEPFVILIF